jgi:hypothetical protein
MTDIHTDRFAIAPGSAILSQCSYCRRRGADGDRCEAFPGGIPDEIRLNDFDHHRPYPGDGGMRFKPRSGVPTTILDRMAPHHPAASFTAPAVASDEIAFSVLSEWADHAATVEAYGYRVSPAFAAALADLLDEQMAGEPEADFAAKAKKAQAKAPAAPQAPAAPGLGNCGTGAGGFKPGNKCGQMRGRHGTGRGGNAKHRKALHEKLKALKAKAKTPAERKALHAAVKELHAYHRGESHVGAERAAHIRRQIHAGRMPHAARSPAILTTAPAPKAPPAPARHPAQAPPAHLGDTIHGHFDHLANEVHASTGYVPIHALRDRIREAHGPEAAGPAFDAALKEGWRSGRYIAEEGGRLTPAQQAAGLRTNSGEALTHLRRGRSYAAPAVRVAPAGPIHPPHVVAATARGAFDELHAARAASATDSDLVPIHEVRARVRERLGDHAASHESLDQHLLDLHRGGHARLLPINDMRGASDRQLSDSILDPQNTWFYLQRRAAEEAASPPARRRARKS